MKCVSFHRGRRYKVIIENYIIAKKVSGISNMIDDELLGTVIVEGTVKQKIFVCFCKFRKTFYEKN